jgi:hypothetical protein
VSTVKEYNETDWLTAENPTYLYLILKNREVYSKRKSRLAAVALCRRVWDNLSPEARLSVETAEQYADREVPFKTMLQTAARVPGVNPMRGSDAKAAQDAAGRRARTTLYDVIGGLLYHWFEPGIHAQRRYDWNRKESWQDEVRLFGRIIRDVFGNPFRPVTVEKTWRTWKDRTIVKLAKGIYEERAFERLPILADALEDAGCGNADLLAHCRGPGPHVRGCWVVDLLLGKR